MRITTDNKALRDLLESGKTDDKNLRKLPKSTISGFLKAIQIISISAKIEDLFRYKGLNYEALEGNLKGFESVRCDRKYRLIFKSFPDEGKIVITNVELINITNHYGKI